MAWSIADRRLTGECIEEVEPLGVGFERVRWKQLKHAFHLASDDQRDAEIGRKCRTQRRLEPSAIAGVLAGQAQEAALERDQASAAFADVQALPARTSPAQPAGGGVFEDLRIGLAQQDGRCVDLKVLDNLIEDDPQGHVQVEA